MDLGQLTTESRLSAAEDLDRLSIIQILQLMNEQDHVIAPAVRNVLHQVAAAVEVIVARLQQGGRLIYLGAGTSGRLGVLDAAECPPTFNTPPWQVIGIIAGGVSALTRAVEGAEDHPEEAIADLQRAQLSERDVLVGIATSGCTPYVLGGLEFARKCGAATVGITCNSEAALSSAAEILIAPVVGPEIISGSTRLKAGTATKMVLNMLSTATMICLGKTYGNLMVDLQVTNAKLLDRSRRIVSAITGLTREDAEIWLQRAEGDVKTAIIMHAHRLSLSNARRHLQYWKGRLRPALEHPPGFVSHDVSRGLEHRQGWLLGVDAGGTKTRAWLVRFTSAAERHDRPGDVLANIVRTQPLGVNPKTPTWQCEGVVFELVGWSEGGPGNPLSIGWASALAHIDRTIHDAFGCASLPREPVTSACLAIAGAGRESVRERLRLWCRQRDLAHCCYITHDAESALSAAIPVGAGVAVISGTGSLVYGRNEQGQTARAGGWGALMSDEGSAYDLVRRALQAVVRAHDGRGPQTMLSSFFLQRAQRSSFDEWVSFVAQHAEDRTFWAGQTQCIFDAVQAGDEVAQQLLQNAAEELSSLVLSVIYKLQLSSHRIIFSGGMFVNYPEYYHVVSQMLERKLSEVTCQLVEYPVLGAIHLACIKATESELQELRT